MRPAYLHTGNFILVGVEVRRIHIIAFESCNSRLYQLCCCQKITFHQLDTACNSYSIHPQFKGIQKDIRTSKIICGLECQFIHKISSQCCIQHISRKCTISIMYQNIFIKHLISSFTQQFHVLLFLIKIALHFFKLHI